MIKKFFNSLNESMKRSSKQFVHKYWYIVFYVFAGIPVIFWFHPNHIIYFWDETFPFSPWLNLYQSFFVWSPVLGFGTLNNNAMTFLPFFLVTSVLSLLFPLWICELIIWYSVFSLSGICMFCLARNFYPKGINHNVSSVFAGIIYMYSPYWIFGGLQDPSTDIMLYSILPLLLLTYHRILSYAFSTRKLFSKYDIEFLILLFFSVLAFASPEIFMLIMLLSLYSVFFFATNYEEKAKVLNALASLAILLVTSIAVFSFWWIPFFTFNPGFSSSLLNTNTGFSNALHGWLVGNSHGFLFALFNIPVTPGTIYPTVYGWNWIKVYTSWPFDLMEVVTPLLAFSSIAMKKKGNKPFYGFAIALALITIILENGVTAPFGLVYNWLFYHIPLWNIFDAPYLWFSPMLCLAYSYLVGITVASFLDIIRARTISSSSRRQMKRVKEGYHKVKIGSIILLLILAALIC